MAHRIIGELIKSEELSEKAKKISFNDGILLEHNQQAYVSLVDAMERDGRACAIRATGTGKMYLAAKLLNDNSDKPFVYIAPTNVILNRFVDTLVDIYFDKKDAEKIKQMTMEDEVKYLEKELGIKLHLYTYAKIHRMSTEEMEKVNASHIVLDEFHRCGADKWGKGVREFLRINSNAKVMGLSATPIRPSDGKNMVEEMFDGKMASELTLVDALEQGILPLPVMVNAIYSFEDEIVSLESQLANKKYNPEKKKEIDKTLKQVKQLIGQSGGVKAIFEDFIEELTRNKGKQDIKMVVFCKDIADRDRKMDECKTWFPKGTKIKRYSVTSKESEKLVELEDDIDESSKSKKLRQKVIETFEQDNSKGVKLLFAVDMLNEGLHVKNLDGVIMLRDTSSNIIFLQQLGRALAVDKDRTTPPLVFDLVNNIGVLGEDIEEYQEIIHRLTENGEYRERLRHHVDFEIQRQIIDIIQYLKDISYTFEDRIAPLLAYYKEFGTIADIKAGYNGTKYEFNGQVYNLGSLISSLRTEYANKKLNNEEIGILEKMGMIWDAKITFEKRVAPLIDYYKKFNTLSNIVQGKNSTKYEFEGRIYDLGNLICMLRDDYSKGKLEIEQVELLESMGMVWKATGFDENNIRIAVKNFVEEYLLFVEKYHKHPQVSGEIEGESLLWDKWNRYTNPVNINEAERQYIMAHIDMHELDNVRMAVKRFVKEYLEFVDIYHRPPNHKGNEPNEEKLYSKWRNYTNPTKINDKEREYLKLNGIELREIKNNDNVRPAVKKFAKEYLQFVDTYHKNPQPNGIIKGEDSLYQKWLRYTNPKNIEEEEIEYLINSGIKLKEEYTVRPCVKQFVQKYLEFIENNHKHPQQDGTIDGESELYDRWLHYTNPKNLKHDDEKQYLINNGIAIREHKLNNDNIRLSIKVFVEQYLKFINENHKSPQYDGAIEGERALYKKWNKYTKSINLKNQEERDYLLANGIEVREIKTKKYTPAPNGENFGQ